MPRRAEKRAQHPQAAAVRERILTAATDLVMTRGPLDTSIADVRRRAAVSGSQLTLHFVDRATLIRAVIARRAGQVLASHHTARWAGLDSLDALDRWAADQVAQLNDLGFREMPTLAGLAGQLHRADEHTRAQLALGYRQWLAIFEGGLARMRRQGVLRAHADPARLALVLLSAHQGGSILACTLRDAEPLRAALAMAVAHVRSFAPPAPPTHSAWRTEPRSG
jgi:AcrR family transcriptional regulator